MKFSLFICFLLSTPFLLSATTIEEKLYDLEGVKFEKFEKEGNDHQLYKLSIKQPIDHKDPSKGYFRQKVYLEHKGFDNVTVMNTQGYNTRFKSNEIEQITDGNYLNIQHRFFGESKPDSLEWKYLTLEQATADLHRINTLFRSIYKGKWIATGISKGGQTSIFYRYFYPSDVDVTIPYVAPLNTNMEDQRIYTFLDSVGTDDCRNRIKEVQLVLFKNREAVLDRLKWFAQGQNLSFNYLDNSIGKAFEYAVLEYPFSFWQWGSNCDDLPSPNNLDANIQSFIDIVGLQFYSDDAMDLYAPHYYQASTQMGYYGYESEGFEEYLIELGKNPNASFPPKGTTPSYTSDLNKKVKQWLDKSGNQFIYINGAWDTWSATSVVPSKKVKAVKFDLPNADHGKARIKNMPTEMKAAFEKTLEQYLNVDIDLTVLD